MGSSLDSVSEVSTDSLFSHESSSNLTHESSDLTNESSNLTHESSNVTVETSIYDSGGLKCMYTNADSIANKWSELETLVCIHQPDIIGITEIFPKGKDFELSSYVLKGFQQIMNGKFTDKGNRGAVLFVRGYLWRLNHLKN